METLHYFDHFENYYRFFLLIERLCCSNQCQPSNITKMGPKESFTVKGEHLIQKIKELIAEGNVRRITITEKSGKEPVSYTHLTLPTIYSV